MAEQDLELKPILETERLQSQTVGRPAAPPTGLTRAHLAMALGVVCVAWSAIFVKWAGVPGPAAAFYRVFVAGVVLVPYWVSRRQPLPPRRGFLLAVVAGVLFALDLATYNIGILATTAANATLMANNAPVWIGLSSFFLFHERLRPRFWGGLALALGGATLILGADLVQRASLGQGDLLALLASVFYAGYLITMQRVRADMSTLTVMSISLTVSLVVLLGLCLGFGIPLAGYSLQAWAALAGLGVVTQLIGWLAINYSLGHIRAAVASVSLLAQPMLTALLSVPLLGEQISTEQVVGGALVLAGIYLVNRSGR